MFYCLAENKTNMDDSHQPKTIKVIKPTFNTRYFNSHTAAPVIMQWSPVARWGDDYQVINMETISIYINDFMCLDLTAMLACQLGNNENIYMLMFS